MLPLSTLAWCRRQFTFRLVVLVSVLLSFLTLAWLRHQISSWLLVLVVLPLSTLTWPLLQQWRDECRFEYRWNDALL